MHRFIKLRKNSLFSKFIITFILFILIPSILLSVFMFYQIQQQLKNELFANSSKILDQLISEIEYKISIIESTADSIAMNTRLRLFLKMPFKKEGNSIREYIGQINPLIRYASTHQKFYIDKIYLFMSNKTIPEGFSTFYKIYRIQDKLWFQTLIKAKEDHLWFTKIDIDSPHKPDVARQGHIISLAKKLIYYEENKKPLLGVLVIDIFASELLKNVFDLNKDSFQIFVMKGDRLFLPEDSLLAQNDSILKDSSDLKKYQHLDNNLFVKNSHTLGLDFYLKMPNTKLSGSYRIILPTASLLLAFLVLIILYYRFIASVIKQIKYNISEMNSIIREGFTRKIPLQKNYELRQISIVFNIAIDKINALLSELVMKELVQKNAQLKALQFQINPHFIYNTLEVFRMKIELAGMYDLSKAMVEFGKMLRYNIDDSSLIFTTIENEMNQIRRYLIIEKIRYCSRISLFEDISRKLSRGQMIKFILQPIVENSLKHGIKSFKQKLRVKIQAKEEGEDIIITVEDNGAGIPDDEINRINRFLDTHVDVTSEDFDKHGLLNVHKRLRLFYGNTAGLKISSLEGKYTRTTIKFSSKTQRHNLSVNE